jgi:branched-chain amino acid transport system substrate-binding protein
VLLTGCGSQLSDDELLVGAGGTPNGGVATQTDGGVVPSGVDPALQQPGAVDTGTGTAAAPGAVTASGGGGAGPGGADGTVAPGATAKPGAKPGAQTGGAVKSGAPIVIGQVGEFSGIAGQAQGPGRTGLQAWAKWVNARGGVAGHPIQLIVRDSGGDASRTASMAKELVERNGAVAIVGAFVALSFDGLKSYAQPAGIPVVGGDGTAAGWFENSMFFSAGTTQSSLNLGYANELVKQGASKIALFYCVELVACSQNNTELQKGAASQGAELVYSTQVSVTTLNFQPQCTNAKNAGAEGIYMIGDAGMVTRMGRDCRQVGFKGPITAPGIGVSNGMAGDPNLQGLTTVAFNFPWMDDSIPGAKEFQAAVRTYAPGADINGSAAQAWAAGHLFAEAVAKIPAGGEVTPDAVKKGLYAVSGTTLGGMAPKLVFKPNQPAEKNRCYFLARIVNNAWTAPQGSKTSCIK